jgi:hypothetical protein
MSGAVQGMIGSLRRGDPYWSNVSMLLTGNGTNGAQNNTFVDSSINNLSIGRAGNATQGTVSPFTATAPYNSATRGGSIYLDGTGDYLAAQQSASAWNFTGSFCLEAWVYLNAFGSGANGTYSLFFATQTVNNYFGVINTAGNTWFDIWDGSTNIRQSSGSQFQLNTWNHVAFVRNGTALTGYLNGVAVVSATLASTFGSNNSAEQLYIGASPTWYPAQYLTNGYISNVRVVRGSAVYTGNFTPPTAPLTAITNTQLLLLGTNAGIIDNAMINNIETIGNTQISPAQSKFGGSSILFDGTGDYLIAPDNAAYRFGTGDFTVECWIYLNVISRVNGIWTNGPASNGSFGFYVTSGNKLEAAYYGGATVTGATSLVANTWYHVAVSRSGTITRVFLNGVQDAINISSNNNTTSKCSVGNSFTSAVDSLNGYIDDLRVTNGMARYTTNFTIPALAFSVLGTDSTFNLQFAGASTLDPRITFTRTSNATQFNSAGSLVYAPNNAIRNNTMVGAVAGTPGTLPTNWARAASPTNGISSQVVGTGTESGVTYLDLRFTGTCSATFGFSLDTDTSSAAAAATGQAWTNSVYLTRSAGTIGNATVQLVLNEYSSVPAFLRNTFSSSVVPAASNLATQRVTQTVTAGASTAFVQQSLSVNFTNGSTYDFTLRIGLPQLEIGPSATAVNVTSGTAYYGPRFDYNPATLAPLGLLIEESRTNNIRNNTMVGAVAGTPGTLPTNWVVDVSSTGLSRQVVGTGVDAGITYIDVRIFGTAAASSYVSVNFETGTAIAATSGQTWTNSFYLKLIGGSTSGIITLPKSGINENTSAGVYITGASGGQLTPTSSWQRSVYTRTLSGGGTVAYAFPYLIIDVSNGAAIDITLRIGLPQMEQGAFATSVIPTTTTALTRAADVASVNTLTPWFNAVEGTLFAEAVAVGLRNPGAQYQVTLGTSGTNENRIRFVDGNVAAQIHSSSGETFAYSTAATINTAYKTALAYKANDSAAAINGTASATDTSVTLPSALTAMYLGQNAVNTQQINGYLRRITYYPRRLANAELQAITT